ncbi:Ctr-domain-containing protein [Coniochaeta ligniaria NRRL 30616]|uniref:Copper transport protein n=1 Tax=Coniochaeta ligniaria NRRL 30616 TaxID=1408157 RepID=A0A1J7J6L5_9PEZI|nr:Ctr-domain-containing protein [Coniochaeta ligniaria NRRL 30616]
MDHSHHDHSSHTMDHGGMDHGHGGMGPMCNMNMLFTWNTENLCIVFKWWHIRSTLGLGIRRYETWVNKRAETAPQSESLTESTPLWRSGQNKVAVTSRAHIIKSVLYGLQNFYAFMIMLIFMTYNGWVMIAVSFGAGLGYLLFGARTTATKDTACH